MISCSLGPVALVINCTASYHTLGVVLLYLITQAGNSELLKITYNNYCVPPITVVEFNNIHSLGLSCKHLGTLECSVYSP